MKTDWESVVEEIGPRLFRYFKYRGSGKASDLSQETFVRLIEKEEKFDPLKGTLLCFALGIARNVWLEAWRKDHATHESLELDEFADHSDLHAELERLDEAKRLRWFVRRLPQVQQDILYYYFDEELTTREIAEILKTPEGTVRSHLHRAKETLRLKFAKELK